VSRPLACFLAFALLFTSAFRAQAEGQEQEAARLEGEGREAFKRGDFPLAAKHFDAANRLSPHAELRYNAALAWERAREPARAADAYEGALRQGGLDQGHQKRAQTALAGLKETLGYVKVPAPISGVLSVAHLTQAPIPAQFHLVPGQYRVQIEGPDGSKITKPISVKAGEVITVEVENASSEPAGTVRRPTTTDEPKETAPEDRPVTTSSSKSTWGWIAIGAGVVSGGVAVYFGTQTLKASKDYEDSDYTDVSARDRGVRNRAITNVAIAGSVIGVGVGAYLLLSGPSKSARKPAPSLRVGLSGPRLSARLDF
jgi:hypothetical protein